MSTSSFITTYSLTPFQILTLYTLIWSMHSICWVVPPTQLFSRVGAKTLAHYLLLIHWLPFTSFIDTFLSTTCLHHSLGLSADYFRTLAHFCYVQISHARAAQFYFFIPFTGELWNYLPLYMFPSFLWHEQFQEGSIKTTSAEVDYFWGRNHPFLSCQSSGLSATFEFVFSPWDSSFSLRKICLTYMAWPFLCIICFLLMKV